MQHKLEVGPENDAMEQEADQIAEQIAGGKSMAFGKAMPPPSAGTGSKMQKTSAEETDKQTGHKVADQDSSGVVQLSAAGNKVQRETSGLTFGGFFSMLFHGIFSFTENQLQDYLKGRDDSDDIEGDFSSDQKAHEIVESWAKGETKYVLTVRRRALLIREMLDGHVSHWDKEGIMAILERSGDAELTYFFAAGGVRHATLIAELDSWKDEVRRFYKRRFGVDDIYKADLSKLKSVGQDPIQLGDKIPEEDADFSSPLADTKKRTKADPITTKESDQWITDVYGQYVPKEKKGGHFLQENVDVNVAVGQGEDNPADLQFKAALQPWCARRRKSMTSQKKKEKGGTLTEAEKQTIQDRYEFCMSDPNIAGFYMTAEEAEEKKPQIWVHRERESATTRLHESIHAYADPAVQGNLPQFAKEGMTEYFTRQIAQRKNLALSTSYEGPFLVIQELSVDFGEPILAQAYFQGKTDLICKSIVGRFGVGAYKTWASAMEDQESWVNALNVLKGPKVVKPPKDFTECKP